MAGPRASFSSAPLWPGLGIVWTPNGAERALKTPSLQGGGQVLAHRDNGWRLFAGVSCELPSTPLSATVSGRRIARRRCASRVPRMYPRCTRVLHEQTTRNARLQAFRISPLTDSNRRPPPYHEREEGVDPCGIPPSGADLRSVSGRRVVVAFCMAVRPWCDPARAASLNSSGRTLSQTRPTTLVESKVVELRRRPLSRARGNRDKPHLCAGFTLK